MAGTPRNSASLRGGGRAFQPTMAMVDGKQRTSSLTRAAHSHEMCAYCAFLHTCNLWQRDNAVGCVNSPQSHFSARSMLFMRRGADR